MATDTLNRNSSTNSPSAPSVGGIDYTGPNYDVGNGFQPGDPSYRPTNPLNPSQNTGTIVNTSSLAPATTNIPYVAPTQPTTSTMPAVDAAANSVDSYIKALSSTTQQPIETQGDALSKQIADLTGQTATQKSDVIAQENALGVNQKISDLSAAQQRVNDLRAAYQKGYANLWSRDKGMALLSGEQAALKAQSESDIAFAQSQVSAIQGDIDTAKSLAQRAVDAKYAPILGQIETKQKQLDALKPLLDKEGQVRAAAQTAALNKLQKDQETQAQEAKDWETLKIDAASGGISKSTLEAADKAWKSGKKEQAYAMTGPYGKAKLEKDYLSSQIAKNYADAEKTRNEGRGIDATTAVGDFGDTINTAKSLLPVNTQKTFVKDVQGAVNRGAYSTAYNMIQNAVSNGLQGDVKNQFDAKVVALPAIDNLQKTLDAYVAANGDTSLLKGTAAQIETKLGKLRETKPEYAKLATDLNIAFQKYRSDVSGAAFSAGESSAYASVNPSSKNDLELNTAVLAGMKQNFQRVIDSTVESKVGKGANYIKEYAQNPNLAPKLNTPESNFVNSAVIPALKTSTSTPNGFIVDVNTFTKSFNK